MSSQNKNTFEYVKALKDKSTEYLSTDPKKALEIAIECYELGKKICPKAKAYGSWAMSNALMYNDRYEEAEQHFLAFRAIFAEQGAHAVRARASIGLIFVWAYLGKQDRALQLSDEIKEVLSKTQEKSWFPDWATNVGVVYELQGKYEESVQIYQDALIIVAQLGRWHQEAMLHQNLALAYIKLNSSRNAVQSFEVAERLFRENKAYDDLTRLNYNYTQLMVKLNRLDDAQDALEKVRPYLHEMGENSWAHHRYSINHALILTQYETAIPLELFAKLSKAQQYFAKNGPRLVEGFAWIILGECHFCNLNFDEAATAFQHALIVAEDNVERSLKHSSVYGLARVSEMLGDFAQAVVLYEQTLGEIDLIRRELFSDLNRSGFCIDKLAIYQALSRIYIQQESIDDTFRTVERARARLISERLSTQIYNDQGSIEDSIEGEEYENYELENNLHFLHRLYRKIEFNELNELEQSNAALGTQIADLEKEISIQLQEAQAKRKSFSPLAIGTHSSVQQVQSNLTNETLFFYFVLHEEVRVFIIKDKEVFSYKCDAPTQEVSELIQRFHLAVHRAITLVSRMGIVGAATSASSLLKAANMPLKRLYDILIAPFLEHIQDEQPLIISPESILSHLPFHALFNGTSYLIEKYPISYVPSGTVLELSMNARITNDKPLLIGYGMDDLPHAEKEITKIAQLIDTDNFYIGESATVQKFIQEVAECRLIHLSTHAQFRADNTMLSFLRMADRNLLLAELSQLQLSAELVVLSGCETGKGLDNGLDLLSLATAFFGAGAHSLVVSKWRVEDEVTTKHMEVFYKSLRYSKSKMQALRDAQLSILASGRNESAYAIYQHPAFWAAFILMGNWKPLY